MEDSAVEDAPPVQTMQEKMREEAVTMAEEHLRVAGAPPDDTRAT